MWSTEEKNWDDAEDFCKQEGGNLASITSKAIKDYVTEGLKTKGLDKVWVGGTDKEEEGVWKWSDNRPFEFKSWADGEPNNANNGENCMDMKSNGWNDDSCQNEVKFLCGKNAQSGKNINFAISI